MAFSRSPSERSQGARIAAYSKWSKTDRVEGTSAARAKFLMRFIEEVDPDRVLPEVERLRRAESAKSAHFARMAYKSARARRKKAS